MWSICYIPKLTMDNLMVMSNWTLTNGNLVEMFIHYVCKNTSSHNPERLTVHVLGTEIAFFYTKMFFAFSLALVLAGGGLGASEKAKNILV